MSNDTGAAADGLRRRAGQALRRMGTARLAGTALVLLLALVLVRFSWSVPLADFAERALYDVRASVSAPHVEQDPRIVMIVYNDETLRQLGKRSPLDRGLLAKALATIDGMAPKAIGIDILIDQPQAEDEELIRTFRAMRTPTALALATNEANAEQMDYEQEQFLRGFQSRIRGTQSRATSIRLETDRDGVIRTWPPRSPGLPPLLAPTLAPEHKGFDDYQGAIRFRAPAQADMGVFTELPIQLFADPAMADALRTSVEGRYVLIGGNINDIDQFETPLTASTGRTTVGLEVHAHMLAQQLDDFRGLVIPDWALWLVALAATGAGALIALLELRLWQTGMAMIGFGLVVLVAPFWMQAQAVDTIGLPVFGAVVGGIVAFAAAGTAARSVTAQQRHFAQAALGKYLPRDIAAEILRDPDRLALHGEKREIFALFSDLEGFTKLSHAIEPEMVAFLLNRYLDMLSEVVLRHGGTIDKFVGDAVVAFWGAPISRPDDCERAVQAAVAMYEAGERFRKEAPEGVPPIGCTRVGLHHGEAIVGNFGGEGRIQYTALGDSMNLAARLESANKQLKTTVLVSETARRQCVSTRLRPMGRVAVRGRSRPIEVFEPVPHMDDADVTRLTALVARFDQGDVTALDELDNHHRAHPEDAAIGNLVYRLRQSGPGGHFGLE